MVLATVYLDKQLLTDFELCPSRYQSSPPNVLELCSTVKNLVYIVACKMAFKWRLR
jgi:hypothetical protein